MWTLQRFGLTVIVSDHVVLTGKCQWPFVCPEAFDDAHGFLYARYSEASRFERHACPVIARLLPTGANAELEPAPAQHIGGGNFLRQRCWMPEVIVKNRAGDAQVRVRYAFYDNLYGLARGHTSRGYRPHFRA